MDKHDEKKEGGTPIERGMFNDDVSPPTLPEESATTLPARLALFNEELKELLGKYQLALGGEAYLHEGKVVARAVVIDKPDGPRK